jgi:pimeloyl-ACP methyl ester carboxylesterase
LAVIDQKTVLVDSNVKILPAFTRLSGKSTRKPIATQRRKTMKVDINGVGIHYVERGQGNPLLLLHGHGESVYTWRHNIESLAPVFKVYAIDLKGFGDSDKPLDGDYSVQAMAELVLDFMDALGVKEKATIVCRSFSGKIGVRAVLKEPSRFNGLALLGSAIGEFDIWPEFLAMAEPGAGEEIMKVYNEENMAPAVERIHDVSYMVTREDIVEFLKPSKSSESINAYLSYFRNFISDGGSLIDEVGGISVPTLIIWGQNDQFISSEHGVLLNEKIPRSKLAVVGNGGHNVHEDQPDEVNRLIIGFFS